MLLGSLPTLKLAKSALFRNFSVRCPIIYLCKLQKFLDTLNVIHYPFSTIDGSPTQVITANINVLVDWILNKRFFLETATGSDRSSTNGSSLRSYHLLVFQESLLHTNSYYLPRYLYQIQPTFLFDSLL